MRVFCAVRHSIDPRFYYGALWSRNFYPALEQLGCEIVESRVDLLPASRFMHIAEEFTNEEVELRAQITQRIVDEVRAAHAAKPIDLFLSYFYNAHFDPSGFEELRRLGIPTVNFYCNSIYQFDLVTEIAPGVDYAWHAERDARKFYLEAGARPIWVQMGADPSIYHPVPNVSRAQSACFIGQRYADRDRWVAELIRANVPFKVYGPNWLQENGGAGGQPGSFEQEYLGRRSDPPGSRRSYVRMIGRNIDQEGLLGGILRTVRQARYRRQTQLLTPIVASHSAAGIPFDRIAETLGQYEVCLNFSNVWSDGRPGSELIPHVRLRDFEGPMCGTCYLTGYSDEIEEFYAIGKEIDSYSSANELVDKTKFYLRNAGAAEGLRAAGYTRARRDHTWTQRFRELFTKVGVNIRASESN